MTSLSGVPVPAVEYAYERGKVRAVEYAYEGGG
jgi:hypothetical protein